MSYQSSIVGLCALAVLLLLPPLAWHTQSRNIPAVILILWLFLMDLTFLVGACIWSAEDFMIRWNGKGWCDIVVKLQVGANVGMPCAVTNIVYNLHTILRANTVLPELDSWKKICCDLAISTTTPIVVMALSYIVQVARFGIVRYNGCQNIMSPTWVTTVLYTMWGLIWSVIGMVYALLVLYVFHQKRKDIRDILYCTNSKLNLARFSRLLILCFLIILIMFPLSVYGVVEDVRSFRSHFSFKEAHSSVTWSIIPKFDEGKRLCNVWLYIVMSYMVFIIFGLSTDALHMYANFLRTLKLGFVVDQVNAMAQKSRESQIAKVFGKISTEAQVTDSTYYSDSTLEKSDNTTLQTKSPTSKSRFFVDYELPFDNNGKKSQAKKKKFGMFSRSKADRQDSFNDDDAPKNKFLPFLSERQVGDDEESLNAATSICSDEHREAPANHQSVVYYAPDSRRNTLIQVDPCSEIMGELPQSLESQGEVSFHYKVERNDSQINAAKP